MKKNIPTDEEVNEFLKESNAIEREYSEQALRDSHQAWMMGNLAAKEGMSISWICGIHRRLLKNLDPEIAGKIRKIQVGVMTNEGFREGTHHSLIRHELKELCKIIPKTAKEIKKWHIKFEHLHPFRDGNGRSGRIIMNVQRLKLGLPILIIHEGEEQFEYYKWFKEGKKWLTIGIEQ